MTAEEYYDMQALRSQVNTLIMENGMLKNRCLELERRLKECEDERKEIIQEDTEEKIPPLFIRVVRDFDSSIFAASVTYPDGRIRVLKTGEFLIALLIFWMQGILSLQNSCLCLSLKIRNGGGRSDFKGEIFIAITRNFTAKSWMIHFVYVSLG